MLQGLEFGDQVLHPDRKIKHQPLRYLQRVSIVWELPTVSRYCMKEFPEKEKRLPDVVLRSYDCDVSVFVEKA